jgi:hypothetical protein
MPVIKPKEPEKSILLAAAAEIEKAFVDRDRARMDIYRFLFEISAKGETILNLDFHQETTAISLARTAAGRIAKAIRLYCNGNSGQADYETAVKHLPVDEALYRRESGHAYGAASKHERLFANIMQSYVLCDQVSNRFLLENGTGPGMAPLTTEDIEKMIDSGYAEIGIHEAPEAQGIMCANCFAHEAIARHAADTDAKNADAQTVRHMFMEGHYLESSHDLTPSSLSTALKLRIVGIKRILMAAALEPSAPEPAAPTVPKHLPRRDLN